MLIERVCSHVGTGNAKINMTVSETFRFLKDCIAVLLISFLFSCMILNILFIGLLSN